MLYFFDSFFSLLCLLRLVIDRIVEIEFKFFDLVLLLLFTVFIFLMILLSYFRIFYLLYLLLYYLFIKL